MWALDSFTYSNSFKAKIVKVKKWKLFTGASTAETIDISISTSQSSQVYGQMILAKLENVSQEGKRGRSRERGSKGAMEKLR